jgi:uncharacterized membrane protein
LLGVGTINQSTLQDVKKDLHMETLFALSIGMSMALGCLLLGFSIFVMKPETPRSIRSQCPADADDL